jgi:hypothetical protein
MANAPIFGAGWREYESDLRREETEMSLWAGLDRANQIEMPHQIGFLAPADAWVFAARRLRDSEEVTNDMFKPSGYVS